MISNMQQIKFKKYMVNILRDYQQTKTKLVHKVQYNLTKIIHCGFVTSLRTSEDLQRKYEELRGTPELQQSNSTELRRTLL